MLNKKIFQQIADKTSKICGYNIIIIDSKGYIIAANDRKRINTYHGGVENVFKNRQSLAKTREEAKELGAQEGILLPIAVKDEVIGVVGITGNPEEVFKYGELVRNQVEMMYQQALLFEMSSVRGEMLDAFYYQLLTLEYNKEHTLHHMEHLASFIGFDLTVPRIAVVIDLHIGKQQKLSSEDYFSIKRKVQQTILHSSDHPQDMITTLDNKAIIFKTLSDKNKGDDDVKSFAGKLYKQIINENEITSYIGIGSYYPGLPGLRKSFLDAQQLIMIANNMKYHKSIFNKEDLIVGRLLNEIGEETKADILQSESFSELFHPQHQELVDTLHAFFQNNLNLSASAKSLVVHRNTLIYRLERVRSITGLNPRNFEQALILSLIISLKSFE